MKKQDLIKIIEEEVKKVLAENIARSGTGASLARAANRGIVLEPGKYEGPIGDPRGKAFNPDLKALHGDYKISSFPTHKKPIPLGFEIAQTERVVQTKEGPVTARKGDYIMTGTKGENWPIPKDKFEKTYDVQPDGKTAAKKKIKVYAVEMRKPFEVKVSWSPDTLKGKPGDFLVQYGPGDYGVVEKGIFKETYNTRAMPKSKPIPTRQAQASDKKKLEIEMKKTMKGKKITEKAIKATLVRFAKVLGIASVPILASAIVKQARDQNWGGVAQELIMASPAGIPIMLSTAFKTALVNNMRKYGLEAAQSAARVKTNILDRI